MFQLGYVLLWMEFEVLVSKNAQQVNARQVGFASITTTLGSVNSEL